MKWLPFFMLSIFLSCKGKENKTAPVTAKQVVENEKQDPVSYNDTVSFPYKTEYDTGYFKGYI